jgi:DNA-binding beta-propeller fold protein YncE/predicted GH43/DUF377 family glycosyl hydrolase
VSGWWVALTLLGCIREVGPGPDLGRCADLPDGVYTFGDAAIGTCIAGPADIEFFEQDGGTFLAVTNADPFRHFRSGSVLILDWDEIAAQLDGEPPERILMHEAPIAAALEILDDDDGDGEGDNPFLGGFGYLPEHQAAVVTSRLTEGSALRSGRDEAFVLDLTEMELSGGVQLVDTLQLEDDPFPVAVEAATQRVYVGNLTDHSVSVLSSRSDLGDGDILTVIDVAPDAGAEAEPIVDVDASGSLATISTVSITDPVEVVEDLWTLTYIDGTVRMYVPTAIDDTGIDGLVRYASGDGVTFSPSAFGFELGLGEVRDAFAEVDLASGVPILWFARADGTIRRARVGDGDPSEWLLDDQPVLAGTYGSPSVAPLEASIGLFVSRVSSAGTSEVALATSLDNITYDFEGPVLSPSAGLSYEDPFVVFDPRANRLRMWLTVRSDDGTVIALSESDDGRDWTEPEEVLVSLEEELAAPVVTLFDGRYVMYHAVDDGLAWRYDAAWSWDGRQWFALDTVLPAQTGYDPLEPPRVALRTEVAGAWRVEGVDVGQISSLLPSGQPPLPLVGFELAVASGQELLNAVIPDQQAARGLVPGSSVLTDEGALLYVTAIGRGTRSQVAILDEDDDESVLAVSPSELSEMLGLGADQGASDPLVYRDDEGFVMFVTVQDGDGTELRRSTSSDGLDWAPLSNQLVLTGEAEFDIAGQYAHSIELLDDGRFRLWYTGTDGATSRIGSAIGDSLRSRLARERGEISEWRFGTGVPGSFDDSSVSHPVVVEIDGQRHLYYTGFDGASRHIGHAIIADDRTILRRTAPGSDLSVPAMDGLARTFSAGGVESPVLTALSDALGGSYLQLWYAGCDTACTPGDGTRRLGRAVVAAVAPDEMFAEQRFPTAGDLLGFVTRRGGPGAQVIELEQNTADLQTLGYGMSSMTLDADRGFLYITTKLDDVIYVLDVHDDTDGSFVDSNALDFEALLQIDTGNTLAGFRDMVLAPTRGLGILAGRNPDQLVVVDLDRIPDDAVKEQVLSTAVGVIPLESASEDAGALTLATFSGSGMALTDDEQLLLVPHFRSNAMSVFDMRLGAWGEEVAWLPNLGENPHLVAISPDGRYAVVANYLGEVEEAFVSSTLAIVDLDPTSDRYLEAVTWLANR